MKTMKNTNLTALLASRIATAALTAVLLVPAAPSWSDVPGGRLGSGRPVPGHPAYGRPGYGRPGDGRPGDGRPGDGRPDYGRPGDGRDDHGPGGIHGSCRELDPRRDGDRRDHHDNTVEIQVARSVGALRGSTSVSLLELLRLSRDCVDARVTGIKIFAESNGRYGAAIGLTKFGRVIASRQIVGARSRLPVNFFLDERGIEIGGLYDGLSLDVQGSAYISRVEVSVAEARRPARLPYVYSTEARVFGALRHVGSTGLVGQGLSRNEFLVGEEVSDLRALKLSARDDAFNVTRLTLRFSNGAEMDVPVGLIFENRDLFVVIDDDDSLGRGRGLYQRELRLRSIVVEGTQGRVFGTRARLDVQMISDTDEYGRRPDGPGHGGPGHGGPGRRP